VDRSTGGCGWRLFSEQCLFFFDFAAALVNPETKCISGKSSSRAMQRNKSRRLKTAQAPGFLPVPRRIPESRIGWRHAPEREPFS
jgi:hypothetical protein